jgi:hypothetical protein
MKYLKCMLILAATMPLCVVAQTQVEWNPQPQTKLFNDTIVIKLNKENIIFITGAKLTAIYDKQAEIDTVLTYLRTDLAQSLNTSQLPEQTTEIVYLYKSLNQRRLKAELPEFTDRQIDIEYEIFRIQQNIPPVRIRVVDLKNELQYQIHTSNPYSLISALSQTSLGVYFAEAFANKKAVLNSTEITVSKNNSNQIEARYNTYKQHVVDAQPFAGPMLVGGELGACFGINLMYKKVNKYHFATRKYGLGITTSSMYQFNERSLYFVQSYDLIYMRLISPPKKDEVWSGFQIGLAHFNNDSELMPKISLSYSQGSGITWLWDNYLSFDKGFIIGFTAKFPL